LRRLSKERKKKFLLRMIQKLELLLPKKRRRELEKNYRKKGKRKGKLLLKIKRDLQIRSSI
jgi:hypothetical protein